MTTIHRTIEVPADRRLNFNLELPDDLPAGRAELHLTILPLPNEAKFLTLADFAGCLKDDQSFAADALEIQREMRNEW